MKNKFFRVCTFIFALTTGMVQASSNPTMSRVYGNQFTPQVADSQSAGTVGALDLTFDTDGSLALTSGLTDPTAQSIQALSDGTFIVALSASSDSILQKYNAEGTLLTGSYGSSGVVTLGAGTTNTARATMIDAQGRCVVAGGAASGSAGWLRRVNADGSGTPQTFATNTSWQYIGGLAQQSSGKIIAVGFNGAGTPLAQIGRYSVGSASAAGSLDTATFGTSGFVIFDGSGSLPTVGTQGLVSVFVDSSDRIYVAFKATATGNGFTNNNAYIARFTALGALDTTWNTTGFAALTALNSATSGLYVAQDHAGDLIVGAQVSTNVVVTGVTSSGSTLIGAGWSAAFNTSSISVIGSDTFVITNLITTYSATDNSIFVVGSDTTAKKMAVIRLSAATGALDTTFNPSLGYNVFRIGTPDTTSQIQAAAIAPDGQLYTAGYQINSATTTPYVSRLNNTQYIAQVAQFPSSAEQGNQDLSFGTTATETYAGVTSPFNGIYGSLLQQKAKSVVELSTGTMLVGMDGFTDTVGTSTISLARLLATGALDTTYNGSGFVTIGNGGTAQTLNAMGVDGSDNVYIAGTKSTGATFCKYLANGTSSWAAVDAVAGAQGVGVAVQGGMRALLFEDIDGTHGRISGYTLAGSAGAGVLDVNFGQGTLGSQTGQILYNAYSLNMGPVYGGVVSPEGLIYIAYKNSSTSRVSVAAIVANGSGLFTTFASSGIYADVFGITTPTVSNIRIGFDLLGQLVVTAVAGSTVYMAGINPDTGALSSIFNTGATLSFTVTGATSLNLTRVTGISDGTTLLTMWDNTTDDSMILARILADGTGLDTTFNSQGSQQGVLPLQIGNEVTNYTARTATSAMIQSSTGNIVVAAFEEVTSSDATPMVMRVYGATGTTEIKDFPTVTTVPGTFAAAFDISTAPDSLGAGSGNVVFVYPNDSVHLGKILVGIDNGTDSKISRLYADTMALDTTFGTSGTYTIPGNLRGISCIALDSAGKILVGGTHTTPAGWAKRLTSNGGIDVSFTMPSAAGSITAVNGIAQQKSGRYVLAGQNTVSATDYPVILAFKDLGSPLVVDPTFNPMLVGGAGSSQFGIFGLGTDIDTPVTGTGLYTISVNSDDTLVVAYASSSFVYLAQVTADGSGYVNAFNSGSPVNTTRLTDGSSAIRVAIDSTGKFVVATSRNNGAAHRVQAARYTTAGVIDSGFNGGASITISNLGSAGITLTGLMESSTQQTVLTGYNSAGGNGRIFAARLAANGTLDATWNPSPTSPDTAGVLTFASGTTPEAVNALSAYIQDDGTIAMIGSSAANSSGDVIVMQVHGDDFVYQVVQSQLQLAAGVLDTTLPDGSSGSMILNGTVYVVGTTQSATITGVPQKIAIYNNTSNGSLVNANGSMVIGSSDGTNSYVTMLNPDLTLNASYGYLFIVPTIIGEYTYSIATMNDMYVTGNISSNEALPILVTGNNGSSMTAVKIAADGSSITYVGNTTGNNPTGMTNGYAIRQSTNERILVAGYNGSLGAIAAFGSVTSGGVLPLDQEFGNQSVSQTFPTGSATTLSNGGGVYLTATASPILDMVVDSLDRMYIAYATTTSNINVQRILADGTGVDSAFGTQTITSSGTGFALDASQQIRIALDATNNKLVVAAQDGTAPGNHIQLQRFSTIDGTPSSLLSDITITSKVLNLSDLFIDAQGYSYVVGYNSTDSKSVVARVTSAFALDTTTYATTGGTPGIANVTAGSMTSVTAGAFNPDRRTYVVGTSGSDAYIARLAGDTYTSQVSESVAVGTAGTIDTTFGSSTPTAGYYNLGTLSGVFTNNGYGVRILALPNGGNYIAIDTDSSGSQLIRTISTGALDTTYGGGDGIGALAPTRPYSMMQDGSGRVILAGTYAGAGWIQRYANGNSGAVDSSFGSSGLIDLGASTAVYAVVEQTLGRLVAAGTNSAGHGALFAYTSINPLTGVTGVLDTTFNFNGATAGVFDTGVAVAVNTLVADQYDRLIFAQLNGAGDAVLLYRLTPTGELDTTFGTAGVKTLGAAAFGSAPNNSGQIYLALNSVGNIVVAARLTSGNIGILVCDNGTVNTANTNGAIYNTQYTISDGSIHVPVLMALATSADGYIYVMGIQDSPGAMWIARLISGDFNTAVALDTTGFNPNAVSPGVAGIFEYAQSGSTFHEYKGLSVRPDGRIEAIGSETISGGVKPMLIRVYNDPYTTQQSQSPDSKIVGTNDLTLGLTGTNAITFFGSTTGNAASAQVARAIGLQDDNNLIVALDGNSAAGSGTSEIMINKFDNDGLLNLSFNTTGHATALAYYSNQYVNDMVTFTTVGGVHKAIIGGYATNATPSLTGSLLMQYNLDTHALDTFGGLNGNPSGVAFGDGKQINVVGVQSTGRIVAGGISQDNLGLLLGYTSNGKLDASFGLGGGYQSISATTGLYTHAIDTLNRIVVAYNNSGTVNVVRFLADGSATDGTSFAAPAGTVTADNQIKVAVGNSNAVYVAAIVASNNSLVVKSYDADGTVANTITKTGTQLGGSVSSNYTISRLLVDESGNVIVVAYDSFGSDKIVVVRFTSSLVLDPTFNAYNAATNPSGVVGGGYVLYAPAGGTTQVATDAMIHPDGRILIVGSEL